MGDTEEVLMRKVTLHCEYCGDFGKFEGTTNTLNYAIEAKSEEHLLDYHHPSFRYDWS